jgi:hypothetical protein
VRDARGLEVARYAHGQRVAAGLRRAASHQERPHRLAAQHLQGDLGIFLFMILSTNRVLSFVHQYIDHLPALVVAVLYNINPSSLIFISPGDKTV